jgi:L-ribulose-5-phosphate 4-epimerase
MRGDLADFRCCHLRNRGIFARATVDSPIRIEMNFSALREEVCFVNKALHSSGLVTMHSGNASGIDRDSGCVLIKPSGFDIEMLTPSDLVATDLSGRTLKAGEVPDGVQTMLRPSVDLVHHVGLYKADANIGGIVHTHSPYATAWAAVGKPIPCTITAVADEFGGPIPCAPYCDNVGEAIVQAILKHRTRSPSILLERHGVFSFGATAKAALKSAVMTESVAKTLYIALSLGELTGMPESEIEKWWGRYHTNYGQR